ncbi:MAG: DNA cytosine methyltransferase, partial [Syntrophales bacterium]|nr:DNA cytosine methyltransferase [Syntrophales bacterium]
MMKKEKVKNNLEKKTAIDLFSGCGGMSYGLRRASFNVVAALEINTVATASYKLNHPKTKLKVTDIRKVDGREWMEELDLSPGELDLLAGCPPCQGFSTLRTRNGACVNKDRRNRLVIEMARFVRTFMPKAIMMENVPGLADKSVFKEFLRSIRKDGYIPTWSVLNVSQYGVPQRRRRLVMLAGHGFKIPFGSKSNKEKTVRMAIEKLKPAGLSGDPLHDMPEKRTAKMKEWISRVPKDGGSRGDLPIEIQRPCHQRSDGFKDVYGRMAWDKVAPTITGGCCNPSKGRFLHPEENRNITMREAALLQTFPKNFRLPSGTTKTDAALMIG